MKTRKLLTSSVLAFCMLIGYVIPITATANTYKDVSTHWACNEIAKWSTYGIIEGDDGQFRPDAAITRAEMSAILGRLMKYQVKENNSFSDLPDAWYTDSVLRAASAGVLLGSDGKVRPEDLITRQEAAVMFGRAFGIQESAGNTAFVDDTQIAPWAKSSVRALADKKIVAGTGNGKFEPTAAITRAAAVKMLDNVVKGFANTAAEISGQTFSGDVVINAPGASLKDVQINGDLIIAEGVGDGNVNLTNVKISGNVYARGGGEHSIYFDSADVAGSIVVNKVGGQLRIVAQGYTNVSAVILETGAIVVSRVQGNGGIKKIEINKDTVGNDSARNVVLIGAFAQVVNNGKNVNISASGNIDELVLNESTTVTGSSKITKAVTGENTNCVINGKSYSGGQTLSPTPDDTQPAGGGGGSTLPTPNPLVYLAAGSSGVRGDACVTDLTSGSFYKVEVGTDNPTINYLKADGTLTGNIAEIGPLTGTKATGLTNLTTYKFIRASHFAGDIYQIKNSGNGAPNEWEAQSGDKLVLKDGTASLKQTQGDPAKCDYIGIPISAFDGLSKSVSVKSALLTSQSGVQPSELSFYFLDTSTWYQFGTSNTEAAKNAENGHYYCYTNPTSQQYWNNWVVFAVANANHQRTYIIDYGNAFITFSLDVANGSTALSGAPTITGTAEKGGVLTAEINGLSVKSNLLYQWQRCKTASGSFENIEGATANTYTLTTADEGMYIRVSVSSSDASGHADSSCILIASSNTNTCTVTFDSNGGTSVDSLQVQKGDKINKPTDPTRTVSGRNIQFLGWYKDPNLTESWNFSTDTVTDNLTLYGSWLRWIVGKNITPKGFAEGYPFATIDANGKIVLNIKLTDATPAAPVELYAIVNVKNGRRTADSESILHGHSGTNSASNPEPPIAVEAWPYQKITDQNVHQINTQVPLQYVYDNDFSTISVELKKSDGTITTQADIDIVETTETELDLTPPKPVGAYINSSRNKVVLYFNEAIHTNSALSAGDFSLSSGTNITKAELISTDVSVLPYTNRGYIILTLASPVPANDSLTISYTPTSGTSITDTATVPNAIQTFTCPVSPAQISVDSTFASGSTPYYYIYLKTNNTCRQGQYTQNQYAISVKYGTDEATASELYSSNDLTCWTKLAEDGSWETWNIRLNYNPTFVTNGKFFITLTPPAGSQDMAMDPAQTIKISVAPGNTQEKDITPTANFDAAQQKLAVTFGTSSGLVSSDSIAACAFKLLKDGKEFTLRGFASFENGVLTFDSGNFPIPPGELKSIMSGAKLTCKSAHPYDPATLLHYDSGKPYAGFTDIQVN